MNIACKTEKRQRLSQQGIDAL